MLMTGILLGAALGAATAGGITLALARKKARLNAEAQEHRSGFLAKASQALNASLDHEATLQKITQLAVPEFATWCSVSLVKEDGSLEVAGFAHDDPEGYELCVQLKQRYPRKPDARRGPPEVVRTGKSELVRSIDDAALIDHSHDPGHLAILRELGLISYICVPLSTRGRVLGAITLVSGRRSYQKEDLEVAEELARRAALTIDNARLFKLANDAVRVRDDFISIASHELRTPLASLKLQIELLIREIRKGETASLSRDQTQKLLETSDRDISRLSRLVLDLLDVSRISNGKLSLRKECFDLGDLASEIIEQFAFEIQESGSKVRLELLGPAPGEWDRFRISQSIINLLTNALKHGRGEPIEIVVGTVDHHAVFSITDHGSGIPASDQNRIFERFEQAHSGGEGGGLGLGLYIARMIVAEHGGRIAVESEHEKGSRFWFELPCRVAEAVS